MITIFNGRRRTLGKENKPDIYAQVSVELRQHLHALKGAKFAVFMAIALHADQNGWAFPSRELLSAETGYGLDTISNALTDLCNTTIDGSRVLLRGRQRIGKASTFGNNTYLIFPTPEEISRFEATQKQAELPPEPAPEPDRVGKMPTRKHRRIHRVGIYHTRFHRIRSTLHKGEPSYKKNQSEELGIGANAPALPGMPGGSSEEPKKGKAKGKKPAYKATPNYYDLMSKIADTCLLDLSEDGALIGKSAKTLDAKGITPEHIDKFMAWWPAGTWQGERGDLPAPYDIVKKWRQFAENYNRSQHQAPKTNHYPKRTSRTPQVADATEAERDAARVKARARIEERAKRREQVGQHAN